MESSRLLFLPLMALDVPSIPVSAVLPSLRLLLLQEPGWRDQEYLLVAPAYNLHWSSGQLHSEPV